MGRVARCGHCDRRRLRLEARSDFRTGFFELEWAREGDGGLAARLRRALDQAEAALPDHVAIPIFLADAMARDLFPRAKSDAAAAPLDVSVRRGRFVGFVASGEGGAVFVDTTGRPGNGRIDDVVRGVLETERVPTASRSRGRSS